MLTPHAPDLWTHAVDHPFLGLKFGARMTVVRLPDGGVWLHSPVPLTEPLKAAVSAVGPVRWIVAPNLLHHLYAGDWAKAFPEARIARAAGLEKKRPDLADALVLDGSSPWGGGLEPLALAGQPQFGETTFFHASSRTLVAADLFANLPPTDHLWTRFYSWMTGLGPKPSTNLVMRSAVKDKAAARRSLDAIIERAPERVIIAHGTPVESGGADAIREAWGWLK